MRTPFITLAVALALALAAVPAQAAIVPGVTVDGPSADIPSTQQVDIDVAPDGTAAIGYLKKVGADNHVFVSSFVNGAWTPSERVDDGLNTFPSRRVSVAVANGGKVAVSFVNAADASPHGVLHVLIKPDAASPFQNPSLATQPYGVNCYYAKLDLGANGDGYAVVSGFGNPQSDLRALRISGNTVARIGDDIPGPAGILDFNPASQPPPDDVFMRPARVATTPDGSQAVVFWSEEAGGADHDLYARRITGTAIGPPQLANVPTLGGFNEVKSANDMADLDIDGSGGAWAVFRENFDYSGTARGRAVARKLVGDAFGPPQVLDALPTPPAEAGEFPRVDLNAAGAGLSANARQLTFGADGAALTGDTWSPFVLNTLTSDSPTAPVPALAESGAGLLAWRHRTDAGSDTEVHARVRALGNLAAETTLSQPGGGPVDSGPEAAADNGKFAAVVFTQGQAANAKIVAAVVDLPEVPGGGGDTVAPRVTGVSAKPKTFRLGRKLPALLSAVKTGTTFRFTLSEDARTRLSFERVAKGRRVRGKCRKPTRKNRRRPSCKRFVKVKRAITVNAKSGPNRVRFQGRFTRRAKLKPGRYRLTVRATDAAGNVSAPARTNFRLLPAVQKKKR
jgi:hypothetical protein